MERTRLPASVED